MPSRQLQLRALQFGPLRLLAVITLTCRDTTVACASRARNANTTSTTVAIAVTSRDRTVGIATICWTNSSALVSRARTESVARSPPTAASVIRREFCLDLNNTYDPNYTSVSVVSTNSTYAPRASMPHCHCVDNEAG